MFGRSDRKDAHDDETSGAPISRRRLIRRVAQGAAVGVGIAAGGTLVGSRTAQAAQGDAVLLGVDVAGATHRTGLFSTTGEVAVLNDPGNDNGVGSVGVWGMGKNYGVFGNAIANSNGSGVAGFGDGNGSGVEARGGSNNAIGLVAFGGGDGDGLVGQAGGGSGTGVVGIGGPTGAGVIAIGVVGVSGIASSGGNSAGVTGRGDGSAPGVLGRGGASGPGVSGDASNAEAGVQAVNHANGPGVYPQSVGGPGVQAVGGGTASAGVTGTGGGSGAGVIGTGGPINGAGVQGNGVGSGAGVSGTSASASGVGVLAGNVGGGTALRINGPAAFSRSGIITVAAGKASATRTGIALASSSLVFPAVQGNVAGVYIQGVAVVTGSSGSFTVHLNKRTPSALKVAWFVLN